MSIYQMKSILNASNRNTSEELIITYNDDRAGLVKDKFAILSKSVNAVV
jgi:hypothetical protein